MRILVCPQEFKGSLTAHEAAAAIAAGVRRALPNAEIIEAPMADGGPGTVAVVAAARNAELVSGSYSGPLGESVEGVYALLAGRDGRPPEAVLEVAATAGLLLVPAASRDPGRAWSAGVGEQLRAALERGARRLTVGVGGTATNDGGAGAAVALGFRLLDRRGRPLPPGAANLHWLDGIDAGGADPRLRESEVRVAVDVQNRLLGPLGATAVYGAQKGAGPALRARLEAALSRWAAICRRDLGVDIAALEGGGAGGGLAAGLVALTGARIESGAALVGEAIGLPRRIAEADLIITGEGSLDAQTAHGKTVAHVATLAGEHGRPCLAVAGSIAARPATIADAEAAGGELEVSEAIARAAELVEQAAERLVHRYAAARTAGGEA